MNIYSLYVIIVEDTRPEIVYGDDNEPFLGTQDQAINYALRMSLDYPQTYRVCHLSTTHIFENGNPA